jgi:putative tryptophan/tyrosine transport system substrate-binding protein
MRRRAFITLVGGGVATWPLVTRAQQAERVRRIGVLMNTAPEESQAGVAAFKQAFQKLSLTVGRNVQIDIRWGENNEDLDRKYAAELIALEPDVFLAYGSLSVAALKRVTGTVPIVFVGVADPEGGGFVDSLSRPGGNVTGFMLYEYSFSGKWLELLKEIVPNLTRAAVLRDSLNRSGIGEFAAIQSVSRSLGIELRPVDTRDADEIERTLAAFARTPNVGMVVTPSATVAVYRTIIALAARYKLPAVYGYRRDVTAGGLISYGPDRVDLFRRAAEYIDRILKGEKPSDMPVQAPTKFELVINLKTAKALGLTIPPAVLTRADEVIE